MHPRLIFSDDIAPRRAIILSAPCVDLEKNIRTCARNNSSELERGASSSRRTVGTLQRQTYIVPFGGYKRRQVLSHGVTAPTSRELSATSPPLAERSGTLPSGNLSTDESGRRVRSQHNHAHQVIRGCEGRNGCGGPRGFVATVPPPCSTNPFLVRL